MNTTKQESLMSIWQELTEEVKHGEHISLDDLMLQLKANNYASEDVYSRALYLTHKVKIELAKENIAFVRLPNGLYGIPSTKEEVEHAMGGYKRSIMQRLYYANLLREYASKHQILPEGFRMQRIELPSFTKEES